MALPACGTVIYAADFSIAGQGSTHDTVGDGFETSPVTGANWTLTFGSLSSDTTTNEFITTGGLIRVQDWGGSGTITSDTIVTTGAGTVDISGAALTIGTDAFNAGAEGITWFYTLNGSTTSLTISGPDPVNSGTDVGNVFSDVAVEAGDILTVGFTVVVDGLSDGVEVSSLTVDFTPIPEPSAPLLSGMACLLAVFRRKRA